MAPTEPSNAELKTLIEGIISAADRRHTEQVRQHTELHTTVKHQGSRLAEFADRLTKVERDARQALDANTDLEGSIMREVGALAANDRAQNARLADIDKETRAQSVILAQHSSTLADVAAEVMPLKAIRKYAKWSWVAILAAPKLWQFLELVWNHVKL